MNPATTTITTGTSSTLTAAAVRDLTKEVKELIANPPPGITIALQNSNISTLLVTIEGPAGTPYEGGVFSFNFHLYDYPTSPPKGVCVTKIFHPNIHPLTGEICVSVLKKDWSPSVGLKQLFLIIKCLLISPNPESALCEEAGKLLLEDYEQYAKQARMVTQIHATTSGKLDATLSGAIASKTSKPAITTIPKPVAKLTAAAAKPVPQPIVSNNTKKVMKKL